MLKIILKSLNPFLSLVVFSLISCAGSPDDSEDAGVTGFILSNSQTASTSRLDILYDKSYSGIVSYIVSTTDLNITNETEFSSSTKTKTSLTIAADSSGNTAYDDYIKLTSLSSNTKYYVYLLDSATGEVKSLTATTKSSGSSVQQTGTITGYNSSSITYYINLPAGYNSSSSTLWPFMLSIKAPNLTLNDPNFPCITFYCDINYSSMTQIQTDIAAVEAKFKAIIDDTSNYKIDTDRIYGCGFSAGACAVVYIANDCTDTQYKFKAVACNGVSNWLFASSSWTGNIEKFDTWFSWGETDGYGMASGETRVTGKDYKALYTGGGEHLLSIYPSTGHDSTITWDTPYTFKWLLNK